MESRVTPVAVIGMGCRLPGGINSPDKLWESLLRGDDLVTEIPPDRWDADDYYDPEPGVPGRSVSRWGGFLDDVAGFDAEFFGISEREATSIDPQQRLLLETSWEAIEHAGLDPASLAGSSTAVFTGLTHEDYLVLTTTAGGLASPYVVTGLNNSVASGRIAHTLGLHGPAMTFDTACSSGLRRRTRVPAEQRSPRGHPWNHNGSAPVPHSAFADTAATTSGLSQRRPSPVRNP